MSGVHKEQQSFYLRESVIAALRKIAEQTDTSMSALADEFLEAQINSFRSKSVTIRNAQILEENLPDSLAGVSEDHPIFGGKKPRLVVSELKTPLKMFQ